MELWLIRHALPVRVDGGDGPADPPLAAAGHEQAEKLARRWAPLGADALVSSPMARAIETAAPLALATGLEPLIVEDIKEFDAHLPTYIPVEELRSDEEAWRAAVEEWLSPAAEEARQAFRDLVVATIDSIAGKAQAEDRERLAIVCHGGVINAYLSRALHLPGTMFFEPAYTSVSRMLWRDGHRQLVSVNETPHLEIPPLPAIAI